MYVVFASAVLFYFYGQSPHETLQLQLKAVSKLYVQIHLYSLPSGDMEGRGLL